MPSCSFPSCSRSSASKGLCKGHYQQTKAGRELQPLRTLDLAKTCAAPGCSLRAVCNGLCDGHYQQQRGSKPLTPLRQRHDVCTFPGCSDPHEAKGYCSGHYSQLRGGKSVREKISVKSAVEIRDGTAYVTLLGLDRSGRKGVQVGSACVDPQDVAMVSGYRWNSSAEGYAVSKANGRGVVMHRLILSVSPELEVDHQDGDRLNNRRSNLRVVTKAEQSQNKKVRSDSGTGHRGVHFDAKKQLYRVFVTLQGVRRGHRHKNLHDAIAEATALRAELMTHCNEDRSVRPTAGVTD